MEGNAWFSSVEGEAETGGKWPIDKPGPAHEVALREITPKARIGAVHGVVAKHGIVFFPDDQPVVAGLETAAGIQNMAAVAAFARRRIGIKSIDVCEVRRGGIQTNSVDADMAVAANAQALARQADEALDVKLAGGDAGNVPGFENNNLSTPRPAKVIGQAVHEQIVAGVFNTLEDGLAFAELAGQADVVPPSQAA